MPTFAIQYGPTALCTWDVNTGNATLHRKASQHDHVLVLGETDKLGFVLNPAPDGKNHRILIGDVSLSDLVPIPDDAWGVSLGGQLFWRELAYFESARGPTKLVLDAQSEGSTTGEWETILVINVYVLPSKLGETRYQGMADDLQKLSRRLLVDLYGKSHQSHDLRCAKAGKAYHSSEQELERIEMVLDRLGVVLDAIGKRPASTVRTVTRRQKYWGGEPITPAAATWLCRRGASASAAERPLTIQNSRCVESFDIPEHRIVRALLDILTHRADYCAEVATGHIGAITSEQHLRHLRLRGGPTIYESVDLPRIRRLQEAIQKADRCAFLARSMTSLYFLRDARPELVAVRGGMFRRSAEYRTLLILIRRFLLAHAVWYKGDEILAVTKLTSRLFEQWCYLRIVEAFRSCGLELREWNDALRENLRSRFVLDFNRGLMFEGELSSDLRLRFRYEPWILGEQSAAKTGETLCRGCRANVAWCPDIVIECLRREGNNWSPVYGIVLDCKYTSRVQSQHWSQTSKYLEIRNTRTKRQVVRQLWLIAPSDRSEIRSEDPAVRFGETGASCAPDEAVRFRLIVVAGATEGARAIDESDPFSQFARGTISFLRREIGAGSSGKAVE